MRLPWRTGFYSKVKYNITSTAPICSGCFCCLGDATLMTYNTLCIKGLLLNRFIGVAQLFTLPFKEVSAHWWCAAPTCISRILESHHNHCCKELRNIFISSLQLNVEAHHYLVHRGWAVEIRQQSVLLWLHSYWQNLHQESISAFSYNAKMGI